MIEIIRKHSDKFLAILLMVCFYVILNASANAVVASQEKRLDAANAAYAVKAHEREQALSDIKKKSKAYAAQVAGMDFDRAEADEANAEALFQTMFNWGDYGSYQEARETLITKYGIPENSDIMTTFFPDAVETEPTKDGSTYNEIDLYQINCSYEKMEPHMTGEAGGVNSYFTIVTWSTFDKYGNEGMAKAAVTYDIDADGNFSNVAAYTLARMV